MIFLRLLGDAALIVDGQLASGRPAQRRQIAILAILAEGHGGTSRDVVMSLLWPEAPTDKARASLNQAVHVLRKALGKSAILEAGGAFTLNPETFEVDLWAFREAAKAADPLTAATHFGGDFLEGFHTNSTTFEKWLQQAQARIGRVYEEICEEAAEHASEQSHHVEAAAWWSRLVHRSPLNSRYAGGSAQSLALSGDAAAALSVLDDHQRVLARELGLELPEAMRALRDEIREGEWASARLVPPMTRAVPRSDESRHPRREAAPTEVAPPEVAPPEAAPQKGSAGRLMKVLAGIGAAVVAAGLWANVPQSEGALELDDNVVFLYHSTFSGSEEFAHLRDWVPVFLGPMIDGAGPLRVADPDLQLPGRDSLVQDHTSDSAASLARRSGAGLYLASSILESSGVLRATAVIHETDSRAVRGRIVTDDYRPSEVTQLLSQLALGIFRELGHDALAPSIVTELTQSAAAVRDYLEAESAYRAGDLTRAIAAYEQALRHDSTFALARLRLATAESFKIGGLMPDGESLLRWREQLPPRYQLLLEAEVASLQSAPLRARQLAQLYRTRYPDDAWGHMKVGAVGWHFGGWLGMHPRIGEHAMTEAILRDPSLYEVRTKSLWYSAHAEDPKRVRADMEVLSARFPDSEWGTIATVGLALLDSLEVNGPTSELRGLISPLDASLRVGPWWFTGDLEGMLSEMESEVAAHSSLGVRFFAAWIPGVMMALGDFSGAWRSFGHPELGPWVRASQRAYLALTPMVEVPVAALEQAFGNLEAYAPESETRTVVRAYLLAQLSVRLGRTADARAWVDTLKAAGAAAEEASLATLSEHYADLVEAHGWIRTSPTASPPPSVAGLAGPLPDHLAHFWVSNAIQGAPFERWLRGEVELARGDFRRAEGWYGLLGKLPEESHYTPLRHLRLGEIAAARGSADSARWHNTRVLRYWSADEPSVAGIAQLAGRRSAELGGLWPHPGPPRH